MVALPQNILSQLVSVSHDRRLRQCAIAAVDLAPGETTPWDLSSIAFQYWPESVQDSKSSEWNARSIPGGSHPIYQWTQGGERTISFTAVFTTDTDPGEVEEEEVNNVVTVSDPYENASRQRLGGVQPGVTDMDIRAAVSWLRYFEYPLYGQGEDLRVYEPPKAQLIMPGTGIGHNGTHYVIAVVKNVEVTYEAFFPSGFPRVCEVQLEFAETVQQNGRVRWHDRRDMSRAALMSTYGRQRT